MRNISGKYLSLLGRQVGLVVLLVQAVRQHLLVLLVL
jgi:hypothetical protein